MSQAEEVLDNLSEDQVVLYSADPSTEEHIVIGSDRFVTVPDSLKKIAVQYDHNVETVTFDCPRYWDGLDMSTMYIYINYIRSDDVKGMSRAKNITVDKSNTKIMHFDWAITRNATFAAGKLSFLVCINKSDSKGNEVNHWNSEVNDQMTVSPGLEYEEQVRAQYPDVITDLLTRMDETEYFVEQSGVIATTEQVAQLKSQVASLKTRVEAAESAVEDAGSNITDGAVTNSKIRDGAVTNKKLADSSVGTSKLIDGAVSAPKIYYGALVSMKYFSIENSAWTENSYGTYNTTVTIEGIDPAKHIGLLMLQRSTMIPDVNTAWGFSASMLDIDNEKMSCIFGCKITAVDELTLTAKEIPSGTLYLTLAVIHI